MFFSFLFLALADGVGIEPTPLRLITFLPLDLLRRDRASKSSHMVLCIPNLQQVGMVSRHLESYSEEAAVSVSRARPHPAGTLSTPNARVADLGNSIARRKHQDCLTLVAGELDVTDVVH